MARFKKFILSVATIAASSAVAQSEPPPSAPPAGFYYFCNSSRLYYPTASECAEGWIAIPVVSPPPVWHPRNPEPSAEEIAEINRQRNVISAEIFGRAIAYSVDYDRAVSPHLTLGLGISTYRQSNWWKDYHATVTVVPIYANYYFSEKIQRAFVTAGVDWIHVSSAGYDSNDTFAKNGVAAVVGGGYEYREKSGFLMRLGGYAIVGRDVDISPSVIFGYSF
jgi:hypothetical protein